MTRYRNAPLVEVIVELRWDSGIAPAFPSVPAGFSSQFPIFDSSSFEKQLSRFSAALGLKGDVHSERLVPSGFPLMAGQVTQRFRRASNAAELYQLGPGIFTANAVPPYVSWKDFIPFLTEGLEMLLASRSDQEKNLPFNVVSLQYIDAFNSSITNGASASDFIKNDLGFVLTTPIAFQDLTKTDQSIKYNFQLNVPLKDDLSLSLSVGEGSANGSSAVVVQTNIQASASVASDIDSILATLDAAQKRHKIIFANMVDKISDRLEPVNE